MGVVSSPVVYRGHYSLVEFREKRGKGGLVSFCWLSILKNKPVDFLFVLFFCTAVSSRLGLRRNKVLIVCVEKEEQVSLCLSVVSNDGQSTPLVLVSVRVLDSFGA